MQSDEKKFTATTDISEYSTFKILDSSKPVSGDIVEVQQDNKKESSEIDSDFDDVRSNIKEIIEKGSTLLDSMIELAKASDHPRAFEVAGNLATSLINANKELLDIHEKKNKIKGNQKSTSDSQTNIQNNTVFVGSPAEVAELFRNKNINHE